LIRICPHLFAFFFYFGEEFFILYKQREENRKIQKYIWSILQTTQHPLKAMKKDPDLSFQSKFIINFQSVYHSQFDSVLIDHKILK